MHREEEVGGRNQLTLLSFFPRTPMTTLASTPEHTPPSLLTISQCWTLSTDLIASENKIFSESLSFIPTFISGEEMVLPGKFYKSHWDLELIFTNPEYWILFPWVKPE
jgi:hypothetical protein